MLRELFDISKVPVGSGWMLHPNHAQKWLLDFTSLCGVLEVAQSLVRLCSLQADTRVFV